MKLYSKKEPIDLKQWQLDTLVNYLNRKLHFAYSYLNAIFKSCENINHLIF